MWAGSTNLLRVLVNLCEEDRDDLKTNDMSLGCIRIINVYLIVGNLNEHTDATRSATHCRSADRLRCPRLHGAFDMKHRLWHGRSMTRSEGVNTGQVVVKVYPYLKMSELTSESRAHRVLWTGGKDPYPRTRGIKGLQMLVLLCFGANHGLHDMRD